MRIVIINSLYSPDIIGGAEISTQILAETLAGAADVHVITVGSHKKYRGIITEMVDGVTVHRTPYNNVYWIGDSSKRSKLHKVVRRLIDLYNPLQIRAVARLMKELKPDVVHTQNLSGFGAGIWSAVYHAGVPIVHTLRDYSLLSPVSSPLAHPLLAKLYKLTSLRFSTRVSAVVGISSHILNRHTSAGLFPRAKQQIIPNVVEGEIAAAGEKALPSQPLSIGYFGRIEPEKGVGELIKAVRSLPQEAVWRLYICGEGGQREELAQECRTDKRIVFTGKVEPEEARKLMAQVDVTVVPSIWEEPFGRVIIESYQAGTPVYASAVGGIPDVVLEPSTFLFAPGSSDAIRNKLLEYGGYTADQRRAIHIRCLEHCQQYTSPVLLKRHLALYHSLLQPASSTRKAVYGTIGNS